MLRNTRHEAGLKGWVEEAATVTDSGPVEPTVARVVDEAPLELVFDQFVRERAGETD